MREHRGRARRGGGPGLLLLLLLFGTAPRTARGEKGGGEAPPVVQGEGEAAADPAPAPQEAEPTPPPALPRFDHRFSIEEIEAAARDLATAFPSLVRMETVGVSRGGHRIVALVLTDAAVAPAGAKPALVVVNDVEAGESRGAEIALRLAWDLAVRQGEEAEVSQLLEQVAIYVLPAVDPDARGEGASGTTGPLRRVRYDLNFPVGWLPDTLRPGAGDYPLSEPETLASARFLEAHPDVAAILDIVPRGFGPGSHAEIDRARSPSGDRAALDAALAALGGKVRAGTASDGARGSLLDHARAARGAFALSIPLEPLEDSTDPVAFAESVAAGARTAEAVARLLPRVTLEERGLERLGPGLWQLDVLLENQGGLPTSSARARARLPRTGVDLTLAGAKLVATAFRNGEQEPYRVLTARVPEGENSIAAGNLGGGESRWLRLVLQAESGAEIDLRGSSPPAGGARLRRALP